MQKTRRNLALGGVGCCGLGGGAVALLFTLGLVGSIVAPSSSGSSSAAPEPVEAAQEAAASPTSTSASPTPDGTAVGLLATLAVADGGDVPGFSGDLFAWNSDTDGNSCDTRDDVLRRDLTSVVLQAGTDGCVVLRGTLTSPYSGQQVDMDHESGTVEIDHLVPLEDAWRHGASGWSPEMRATFANDPLNLVTVLADDVSLKAGAGAAEWLPTDDGYRCEYVARQVAVKKKYELTVSADEADAMGTVLRACDGLPEFTADTAWPAPGQGDIAATEPEVTQAPAPVTQAPPTTQPAPVETTTAPQEAKKAPAETKKAPAAPKQEPAPEKSTKAPASDEGSVYYKNCTEARAAGAAPIHRGEPGYASKLDRDDDGVACE